MLNGDIIMVDLNTLNEFRDVNLEKEIFGTRGDSENGVFRLNYKCLPYFIIASTGDGWEHVSISTHNQTPSWKLMCKIKNMFFNEDEIVVQYHPREKDYINIHEHCLHLWRPLNEKLPLPSEYIEDINSQNGKTELMFLDKEKYKIVNSSDDEWKKISITSKKTTPSWDLMCQIKNKYWNKDKVAVQYILPSTNPDSHCLTIYEPLLEHLPTPPTYMIGFRDDEEIENHYKNLEDKTQTNTL